ncbi:serine/threonine protein kinase [Adhaeretor mobilis]|uniref:non-specific serine/threonine protein kinase n=1 Tax=Adhaeretor mobilis TaxID=1930276 RepID=A0A517MRG2_9BACT|nr:serine/threonine-protein kinase [Adhaeretor mobilis]QDS97472.1 Serine/threonine-protein kinase PrkC [Adhaeretor mobilis]
MSLTPSNPSPRRMKFIPTKSTFQLHEQMGIGTVGAVFRATSPDFEEPVAVKLLHPNIAHDPNIVDRFQREIVIMQKLNHPHIVRHYGGGILDGQYFYAMQLLEHGSLKDRLTQHGPLPWPQAAAYASQIASALQHAHNHGIIHRDLKPSNLFFDDSGDVVLGDFGIARDTHETDITADGITVGTYAYMSPEQITADGEITAQADLYSLGCVLYEMLAGRPPYTGANFAQIWDQHLHKQPKPLAEYGVDCPDWLEELIMNLLAKDAQDRPFNARSVQGLIRDRLEDKFGEESRELTHDLPPLEVDSSGNRTLRMLVVFGVLAALITWAVISGG